MTAAKLVAYAAGLALYVLSILFALQVWGGVGAFAAFMFPPFLLAFPIVAAVTGYAVPVWLWGLWGVGVVASLFVARADN